LKYSTEGLDKKILNHFKIKSKRNSDLKNWKDFNKKLNNTKSTVSIAIVGKYTHLRDAYKSIDEAITHSGVKNNVNVDIKWIESSDLNNQKTIEKKLKNISGVLIPGGFGKRGVDGKINTINYCRKNNVPFFGICFGMQIAIIELSRNLLKLKSANSTELSKTKNPVVCLLEEWKNKRKIFKGELNKIGGSMRLGSYPAKVKSGSLLSKIYNNKKIIYERHRHRYEVNINYKSKLEKKGVIFSAISPYNNLPEAVELKNHRWFIGVQFHPELTSKPFKPHELFSAFIDSAIKYRDEVLKNEK